MEIAKAGISGTLFPAVEEEFSPSLNVCESISRGAPAGLKAVAVNLKRKGGKSRDESRMRLFVLMAAMAMVSAGCVYVQRSESRIHVVSENAEGVGTLSSASGGSGGYDCQKEHEECVGRCWNKKNWPYPHNKKQSGWYLERCEHDCSEEFRKCEEEQEEVARETGKRLEFSRMNEAIGWIRNHKTEVVLGTVVIVAGVAFVLTTGGSGALILAPLAL